MSPEPQHAAAGPDTRFCPLCGERNACAMETETAIGLKQPPCWCTQVSFDATLLARVPAESRNLACICARCAANPPTPST